MKKVILAVSVIAALATVLWIANIGEAKKKDPTVHDGNYGLYYEPLSTRYGAGGFIHLGYTVDTKAEL